MNKYIKLAMLVSAVSLSTSCNEVKDTADRDQQIKTEKLLDEANKQIGMPNIVNFQQRKTLKMIYELCDNEDLICYAYLQNQYTGKLVYVGKCVGYGIPFSAQFTNPEKLIDAESQLGIMLHADAGRVHTTPQADPNGLFMPTSSSATWLLMLDNETNEPRPVYFEPTIVVSPFKLTDGTE